MRIANASEAKPGCRRLPGCGLFERPLQVDAIL